MCLLIGNQVTKRSGIQRCNGLCSFSWQNHSHKAFLAWAMSVLSHEDGNVPYSRLRTPNYFTSHPAEGRSFIQPLFGKLMWFPVSVKPENPLLCCRFGTHPRVRCGLSLTYYTSVRWIFFTRILQPHYVCRVAADPRYSFKIEELFRYNMQRFQHYKFFSTLIGQKASCNAFTEALSCTNYFRFRY